MWDFCVSFIVCVALFIILSTIQLLLDLVYLSLFKNNAILNDKKKEKK